MLRQISPVPEHCFISVSINNNLNSAHISCVGTTLRGSAEFRAQFFFFSEEMENDIEFEWCSGCGEIQLGKVTNTRTCHILSLICDD